MEEEINLGIVGCGWAGKRHYQAASNLPNLKVTAIAEKDKKKLENRKSEWEVKEAYEDYENMFEQANIDACVIALPHDL